MNLNWIKSIPWRVRVLVTRTTVWGKEGEEQEVHKESWRSAWAIVGIHSWRWWWVRKYGKLPCGCTRNPLTRRMVLFRWKCPVHFPEDQTDFSEE
jgi:hypothetical protein